MTGDALREVAVKQVIITRELRGTGKPDNIYRLVTKIWTLDGILMAENDPCPEGIDDD